METVKAGCILINKKSKKIAIIYRDKKDDYTFPKGHKEENESIEECAIRETAEETKRIAIIERNYEPFIESYVTDRGENCVCYYYFALDGGFSNNKSTDTHLTV